MPIKCGKSGWPSDFVWIVTRLDFRTQNIVITLPAAECFAESLQMSYANRQRLSVLNSRTIWSKQQKLIHNSEPYTLCIALCITHRLSWIINLVRCILCDTRLISTTSLFTLWLQERLKTYVWNQPSVQRKALVLYELLLFLFSLLESKCRSK